MNEIPTPDARQEPSSPGDGYLHRIQPMVTLMIAVAAIGLGIWEGAETTPSFDEQKFYFESHHGSCTGDWPRFYRPTSTHVNFGCGALNIRFSHKAGRLTDRALARVTRTELVGTRKECVLWDKNAQGRQTCSRYIDVPVEKKIQKAAYVSVALTQ